MIRLVIAISLFLVVGGCSTPYNETGFRGGYSETQLDENVFKVSFNGNAYTSGDRATDFTFLRSAEISLEHGFKYFAIIDAESSTKNSTYTTPVTSNTNVNVYGSGNNSYGTATTTSSGGQTYNYSKPQRTNTIVCFIEKPDELFTYNAEFVFQSISEKYEIEPDDE